MSGKDKQVGERSEGNDTNTQELPIASSGVNITNGESALLIDIHEKDGKPAAPAPTYTPSGPTEAGETSGGYDVIPDDVQKVTINIPEKRPLSPTARAEGMISPQHWRGMFPTNEGNNRPIMRRKNLTDWVEVNSSESWILEEKFKSLQDALVVEEYCQPKIQGVPFIMRRYERSYTWYQPRMVSIGPCHHQAIPKWKEAEKLKLKLAALFVEEHGLQKDVLYSKIKKEIKDLRNCYKNEEIRWQAEERFNNDDELTWMFFVDGCAILHYIHCAVNNSTKRILELKVKVDSLTYMQHDLFLLENQLPYRVLDLVMSCLNNENEMRESIEKFIFDSIRAPWEKQDEGELRQYQNERPIHLLDLLRTKLLQSVEKEKTPYLIVQQLINNVVKFITEPLEEFQDLIECIGKAFENSTCPETQDLHFFRSVEELKATGIRIRPSNTGRLTDITYNLGTFKLPPIIVDDSTASKFLNLIAYEMCPDFVNDLGVTSYILFLDALIDRAQDVKELRDKHILHNALGSDEEVAKLFNEIGTNLVSNPEAYLDVKRAIQKRCGNRWMTWIAQFNHRHFQSPWSVLAFLAAIIVVVSTFLQTLYTILGYYK